jgi:hypothetical protein
MTGYTVPRAAQAALPALIIFSKSPGAAVFRIEDQTKTAYYAIRNVANMRPRFAENIFRAS